MKKYPNYFWLLSICFLLSSCAALPDNSQQLYSTAPTDTDSTTLGKGVWKLSRKNPGKSGFILLDDGLDAFVARAKLASLAERTIDVQYYLFNDDTVGALVAYSLLQAADRGVRVRILLDDMGLADRDASLVTLDNHPNIEIRIFNPFSRMYSRHVQFITRLGDVTRRMHNKSFTVDNQVTVVGGRNIGDEYFNADPDLAFGDLDVMAIGPVVKEVSDSFDRYWNSQLAYSVASLLSQEIPLSQLDEVRPEWDQFVNEQKDSDYYRALLNSNLGRKIINHETVEYMWGSAKAIYDQPEKVVESIDNRELHLAPLLRPYFEQLEDELIIISAYFVPGNKGVEFLSQLSKKGVRVRILTNSLASTDVTLVHGGYGHYRKDMLRAGVELYEIDKQLTKKQRKEMKTSSSNASLHAKAFVFDRKYLFIGSLNSDPRSIEQNTEIGIVIESPELVKMMGEVFERTITEEAFALELGKNFMGMDAIRWVSNKGGETKVYTDEPHSSLWRRFLATMAMILPIESQL